MNLSWIFGRLDFFFEILKQFVKYLKQVFFYNWIFPLSTIRCPDLQTFHHRTLFPTAQEL